MRIFPFLPLAFAACGDAPMAADPVRVASLDLGNEVTLQFDQTEDGTVLVSELAPGDQLGVLTALTLQGATPLEVYLAVAPDSEAPEALIENHLRFAGSDVPLEPRQFDLETADVDGADASFFPQLYATSCSGDGPWFDDTWQDAGWNWHWYWNSSSGSFKYTASRTTSTFHTHVCNTSRVPDFTQHCVQGNLFLGNLACQDVPVGWRSVYVTLGVNDSWRGLMTGWNGNTGNFRLGAMSP